MHPNCVVQHTPSPVLLRLRLPFHGSEKGRSQLTLFCYLQAGVAHFNIDDGEVLQMKSQIKLESLI